MDEIQIQEIADLIVAGGALAFRLFQKLEPLLNIGPDEKQNIMNALVASDQADEETITAASNWLAANPEHPDPL